MSDKIICKYCKEEVDIDFEEHKDRKKRIILKGKCPSCNKTNVKYPKKEYPEVPSEPPSELPSEEPPEVPSEGEQVAEIVKGVVTSPELKEAITEEEEEEDKDKKPLPIALIIAVSVILVLVIVSLWLFTQYLEYQKIKEEKHGDKEG